jgi:hypothetical protein
VAHYAETWPPTKAPSANCFGLLMAVGPRAVTPSLQMPWKRKSAMVASGSCELESGGR